MRLWLIVISLGSTLEQPPLLVGVPPPRLRVTRLRRSQAFGRLAMTDYDIETIRRAQVELALEGKDFGDHIDRLYEKYYSLWEALHEMQEKLGEVVAFYDPAPLPLKYK